MGTALCYGMIQKGETVEDTKSSGVGANPGFTIWKLFVTKLLKPLLHPLFLLPPEINRSGMNSSTTPTGSVGFKQAACPLSFIFLVSKMEQA